MMTTLSRRSPSPCGRGCGLQTLKFLGVSPKMALHSIGRIGLMRSNLNPFTTEVRRALEWFKDHVLTGTSGSISCVERETFFLFLDGACSEVTEADEWSGVFSMSSKQRYCLMPFACGLGPPPKHACVFVFIDNEAARACGLLVSPSRRRRDGSSTMVP